MNDANATIHDFDDYLQRWLKPVAGTLGETQRHKLLYDVYVLGLARTGKPPFESTCKAWKQGPVFPEIRQRNASGDHRKLTTEQEKVCNFVAEELGGIFGKALSERSHTFPEWQEARRRGHNDTITNEDIIKALRAGIDFRPDGPRITCSDALRWCEVSDFLQTFRPTPNE